jgi:Asp-tRNA(Asn)/Glu-tRNA(Gln) amidotransferase C subunit
LTALGGAGVVSAGVANYLADRSLEKQKAALGRETERLKGELAKDTETHKLKLKKQELLFAKELEAATKFFELNRRFGPKRRHPETDWHEVREDVINDFGRAEKALQEFVAEHGPVLSRQNRKDLESCIAMASASKFAGVPGGDDMKEAKEAADKFLETLNKIEERFVRELRS